MEGVDKSMNLDVYGTSFDHDKFERLKKERWIKCNLLIYCKVHETHFSQEENDPYAEPCWQCHDECQERI